MHIPGYCMKGRMSNSAKMVSRSSLIFCFFLCSSKYSRETHTHTYLRDDKKNRKTHGLASGDKVTTNFLVFFRGLGYHIPDTHNRHAPSLSPSHSPSHSHSPSRSPSTLTLTITLTAPS